MFDLCLIRKLNTFYLGVDTNENDLLYTVSKTKPNIILTYLITNFSDWNAQEYVQRLSQTFINENIVVCGPGFKDVSNNQQNVTIMRSIRELIKYCEAI